MNEMTDKIADAGTNESAIIYLKPKEKIFAKLKDISEDLLDLEENKINQYLDNNLLETHVVPVCTPLFNTPNDLYFFIENNSKILFDFMLTSFPFPIKQWKFTDKNIKLFNEFVDIKYFPIVCKIITKPVKSTMDLAVTFATPTRHLIDYIAERISSKKMILNEKEMEMLEFILSTGIAIVTNNVERSTNQNTIEYIMLLEDSKNFLTSLKNNVLKTLFYLYFKNKEEFPEESSDDDLNKWFNTKTYLGMYMLTEPSIAKKYANNSR